jgi:hypothetical protein
MLCPDGKPNDAGHSASGGCEVEGGRNYGSPAQARSGSLGHEGRVRKPKSRLRQEKAGTLKATEWTTVEWEPENPSGYEQARADGRAPLPVARAIFPALLVVLDLGLPSFMPLTATCAASSTGSRRPS